MIYCHYFGARYYDSDISIWLSVDPLAQERPWLSPYNYCQLNPIGRIDPTGALDSEHIDKFGNIIASYDDGDNSVYMHSSGTTQSQIDKQRATMNNTGGSGQKIGELGGNIDVSLIMNNKLDQSSQEAKKMGITEYFFAVKPGSKWDLKANTTTIFGKAWEFDDNNQTKTTFSFGKYTGLNAADVGNYHGGYTGRYTYNGAGMPYGLLQWGAGAAEAFKSIDDGRFGDFGLQIPQLLGGPTGPYPPYGDRMRDYVFNTIGMMDADKNKLPKANVGRTR